MSLQAFRHPSNSRARPGRVLAPRVASVALLALGCSFTAWAQTPAAPSEAPAPAAAPAPIPAAAATPSPASTSSASAATADSATSPVDAYAAFRREFDAARYVEAVPHARRVLEVTEQQATNPTAEDVQVALMNLGMVQNLAEDYVGAEASYQRVIKLIESSGRPQHARLARAHAGLASAYHDTRRHELAVKSFEQAIALTRRHEGLLTDRQVPLVEKYIDSLTQLGRYQEALQAQKYLLRVATRQHGESSVELAPRLEQIGRWYASVGAYDQSRRILKQAIGIVESAEGEQSQRLVGPLLALAACNRKQLLDPTQAQGGVDAEQSSRFSDPTAPVIPSGYSTGMMSAEGERALLRAASITDSVASPAPAQVANVRTQLGDWYQLRNQPDRALANYRQAWAAANRIGEKLDGKPYTEVVFGKPVLLQVVRPEGWDRNATRPPDTLEVRTVVIEATIDVAGRAIDAKVIDDSGDTRRADRTLRAVTETGRYRPRFEGGEPAVTTGVRFEQPWILELPDPDKEPAKPPEKEPVSAPAPASAPAS